MKILYINATMGAAGDMLTSALLELTDDIDASVAELNAIGIPGVEYTVTKKQSKGITGTHMNVTVHGVSEDEIHEHHEHHEHHDHDHEHHEHEHAHAHEHEHHHHHSSMHDIEHIISHLNVSYEVKGDAVKVYGLIADAESKAHGVSVTDIHFHEVGTMDAIADVVAVCKLIRDLAPDRIIVSELCTGFGTVNCAHGTLPVPAPATAHIIEGMPVFAGSEEGERLTPTGAALIKYFADEFGQIPNMVISRSGYGMGTKEFRNGNFVRVSIGTADDEMIELETNVDDMTAEQISFASEMLFEAGAVEVFTTPVTMKKSRPGTMITALCRESDRDSVVNAFFKHTSTIGIREKSIKRHVLTRTVETVSTRYGDVRLKKSTGYGVSKEKYEFDDIARIAKENNLSIKEVLESL